MAPSFDWQARYDSADTPWDLGGPHPELSSRLSSGDLAPPVPGARALVPGAGRGHDALALARRGWRVTAVELVPGLAEDSSGATDNVALELDKRGGAYLVGDVFEATPAEAFDLIWDHTFFCALPPARRAEWGDIACERSREGTLYLSLVFPFGKPVEDLGPPFGMDAAAVQAALGAGFELEYDIPVERPVKRRTWPERIARFVRRT